MMPENSLSEDFAIPYFLKGKTPLCAEVDPDLFFPIEEDLPQTAHTRATVSFAHKKAIEICRKCECAVECLTYAIENDINFGVWGGTTPPQRQSIRRARRLPLSVKQR